MVDPKPTWQTHSGTLFAVAVNYCTGQECNVEDAEDAEDAEHCAVSGYGDVESLVGGTGSAGDTWWRHTDDSRQHGLGHTLVAWRTGSGFFLSDNAQSYHCVEKDQEEREHQREVARKTGPIAPLG